MAKLDFLFINKSTTQVIVPIFAFEFFPAGK